MKIRSSLFFLILVLNSPVYSFEGTFSNNGQLGETVLAVESCFNDNDTKNLELLKKNLNHLLEWRKKLGDTTADSTKLFKIDTTSTGACSVIIDDYLPKQIREVLWQKPEIDGPNCWNFASVIGRLASGFRHMSDEEFGLWMESPLCKKIPPTEIRAMGDIGVIRQTRDFFHETQKKEKTHDPYTKEVHAFAWIAGNLAFSKNGFKKRSGYGLYSEEEVLEKYEVSRFSKKCAWVGQEPPKECGLFVQYFRCETFTEFLKKSSFHLGLEKERVLADLDLVEAELSENVFGRMLTKKRKQIPSNKEYKVLKEKLEEYKTKIRQWNQTENLEKEVLFIQGLEISRINSFLIQISNIMSENK